MKPKTSTEQGRTSHPCAVEHVQVGEMVDPASLPAKILREGGGWVKVEYGPANFRSFRAVYVCKGAHKDGQWGWQCKEIR